MDDLNPTPAPAADTPAPAASAVPDDTPWGPYRDQLRATWGGTEAEFAAAWQQVVPQLDAAYADGLATVQAQANRAQAAAAPVIAVSIQTPPALVAAAQAAEARRAEDARKAALEAAIAQYAPPGSVRWPDEPRPYDPSQDHPPGDLTFWRSYYAGRYRLHPTEIAGHTKTEMEASAQALDRRNRGIKDPTPPRMEDFIPPGAVPWSDGPAAPDLTAPATYVPPGAVYWPDEEGRALERQVQQPRNSKGQWE